eukprot:tig00021366_g20857.t1
MGDPRVSRGIIVDTPTLPSPHDDRDSPPDTDEDTSSDSEPEIKDVAADLGHRHAWTILRLKPVVHNQLHPETPTLFAASELTSCMHLAAARSNTPTGQPLLGTRPSDQAHYLLQHLTEFRSVIHVIMRLARAQPFAPGETATTWPHPNDPLADVLGRPEMLELFGLTPTEFTLVHQSKTPVVPCILQVAVNLARNLRTLHYDVEMTESDERFLNFDKITNTATRLATIRQLVQTVKFTAPLTGPDDIYLSTLRHGSPPPDIALSMRSTALARAWDIAAYFDHYKWDETRDRYGDSDLLTSTTRRRGPGNFLRRYYTSRFNPKSDANPATNQRATAELAEEIRLNSQLAVVAARDVHRLRTPPVSEAQAPREKRPNDEKLQKKERKAARLTPEEVDSIISRILSELHTVPFKEVLLSENADIPDVYFWAFLNEEWAKGFTVVDGAGYQHGVWPDLSGVMVRREPRPDSTENERDTFYAGFGRRNNHINGELFAQTINDCPEETRAGGDFLPLDTDPGRDTSYHIFMTPLLFTNTDFLATAYCKTIQEHGRHAPHIFAVAAHILGGPAPFGQTADLTEELTVEDGHRPEELPEPPPVEELEGIPTRDPPPVHPATTTKKYMHVLGEVHMPYVLLGDSGLEAFLRRVPYMRPFLMKMHVRWSNFSRALSRVLRYGVGPGTYPYRAGAPGHGELSQHNRAGLPFRSFLITAADEFHPANKYADYFDCIYDEDNHAHLRDSASRQDVERCFYEIAMPDDLNAPPMTLTPANADLCGPRIVRFTHVAPAGPSRGAPNTIQNRSHITIFDANNRNTWQQIIAGTRKPQTRRRAAPVRPDPKYFPVSVNDYTGPGGVVVSLRRRGPTGTAPATPPVVHQVLVKLHGALSFFLEPLPGELGNIIIDYVRSHEDELHFRFTASGEVARSAKLDKWYEVEYPDCERVDPAHLITAFESLLHKATNDWLAVQIKHETPPAAREDVDMDRNHCWPVAFRLPDGVINALNAQVRGADFDPTNDPSHPHRPSVYDVNASAVRNAIMDFEQRYADIHEQFRHAEYGNFTFDPFYNEFGAAIFSREPQARALLHGWLEQFVYNHATVDAATRRPITFTSREAYRAVQIVDVLPLRHSLGDPDNDSLLRQIPTFTLVTAPTARLSTRTKAARASLTS